MMNEAPPPAASDAGNAIKSLDATTISIPEADIAVSGDIDEVTETISTNLPPGWLDTVKSTIAQKKEKLEPWSKFADVRNASKPKDISEMSGRIMHNISRFHANYFFVAMFLVAYCLITNPLIVVALGLLGVTAMVATRGNAERTIMGKTFTREEQLKSAALLTIPLLWISGAGGAFFWVLGATGVLVVGHAAFIPVEDDVLGAVEGV